jgi:phosphohistidine phosphatase
MKRLTLLRHAKSDWGDPSLKDFDRPLNDRGWKSARRMGRELSKRGMEFDLVVASPAARVRETIDGLTEKLKLNVEIRFEPRMYGATADELMGIVRGLPETARSPLLVGHNPGFHQFVLELAAAGDKLRDRVAHNLPTAALVQVGLPANRWTEVESGSGEIAALILPKELD